MVCHPRAVLALHLASWTLLAISVGALGFFASGLYVTARHFARPKQVWSGAWPGVSLLKPLKGVEEELDANLESLFVQTYAGECEVVFATTDADDAALPIARAVAARHPEVPSRFVLSDATFGLNPKLSNLAGALDAAKFDVVLQSDANVRLMPDYLERVVGELLSEDASLLSSMVVGEGEDSVGAALENLQLSAFIAPATCVALYFAGITVVIGKSMLFRKSELATLGGLAAFKDYLAEDFIVGAAYEKAGKKVLLSTTRVGNVNVHAPVDRFLSRHVRWLLMRAVIHVPGFVGDIMGNPVAFGLVGVALGGFRPVPLAVYGGIVLGKLTLDAVLVHRTRGSWMKLRFLLLAPLKDLLMAAIWPWAAVCRTVEWRGTKLRVGKGSALSAVRESSARSAQRHPAARAR